MSRFIYYRGSLSSCNYGCPYCPFAKTSNTRAALAVDAAGVDRFVTWMSRQTTERHQILFTPWGEALIRGYYRKALVQLSRLEQVDTVAAQTNLSFPIADLAEADRRRLALWATYHPGETDRATFLAQCRALDELQMDYSVGVVGLKEHFDEIKAVRAALPEFRYLWINAYKREPDYYSEADIAFLTEIDPWFPLNLETYDSGDQACRAGASSFAVDEKGDVRRCFFIPGVIGNIEDPAFEAGLKPRPCTNASCGCYIGYIHLARLQLDSVYRRRLAARIPVAYQTEPVGAEETGPT
ncbi:STM4011 family radical SAM protein [Acanthopleuribacter pedis]|uniref:STM4011 family radical SAM protein n=1 Tax=Acanthopleuribacter pedis TaxID=442870 RepID=A0A8J7Q8U3_9BACT|nr:STM4011 family radical SAM protein [Acanthopleuribacter pedis]MBO1322612.1 STM4011 family radical SAM protein [Acanthopleuribacter pedis]